MAGILRGAAVGVAEATGGAALSLQRRWSQWMFLVVAIPAVGDALTLCHVWFMAGGVMFSLFRTGSYYPQDAASEVTEVQAGLAKQEVNDHGQ